MAEVDRTQLHILWFEETNKKDVALVGGKNASLGEMTVSGIPVPPGFSVTSFAYRAFLDETGLSEKIYSSLEKIDVADTAKLEALSNRIREAIESADVSMKISNEVTKAYRKLCDRTIPNVAVAVRSSATAEDLPGASFAGQQETSST